MRNGRIYGCYELDSDGMEELIYVGSTTRNTLSREKEHRSRRNGASRFHKHLSTTKNKTVFKEICDYPCQTKKELEGKEAQIIHDKIEEGKDLYNTVKYKKKITSIYDQQQSRLSPKETRFKIIHNEQKKMLRIHYKNSDHKDCEVSKRYGRCGYDEAMKWMLDQQEKLRREWYD